MSPLRNGRTIPWTTAWTFERASNYVSKVAYDAGLRIPPVRDDAKPLLRLQYVAQRQVPNVWTGTPTSRSDERDLREVLESCRVTLSLDGPVVQTRDLEELSRKSADEPRALEDVGLLRAILEDGLCEWMLRGRTRDVRACLWCGDLFRSDRAGALFDGAACRTAFHRARNTAAEQGGSEVKRGIQALLGAFECGNCERCLLIDEASGLVRLGPKQIYIGGVRRGGSVAPICRSCAYENHPEWADYIVPMSAAA